MRGTTTQSDPRPRDARPVALELEIPVLVLSQRIHEAESRVDQRPRMADLRESGSLEQNADVVMRLHRPDHSHPNDQPGLAELIVAKDRNGASRTVDLKLEAATMRFADRADTTALPCL